MSATDVLFGFRPAPAERLAALRLVLGSGALVYTIVRAGHLADVARHSARQFDPVGPVAILGAPLPATVVIGLVALTIALGIAFVAGWRFRRGEDD